jgi:hypothetical protein
LVRKRLKNVVWEAILRRDKAEKDLHIGHLQPKSATAGHGSEA